MGTERLGAEREPTGYLDIEAEPVTLEPTTPISRPIMLQGWYNLTQIHWRYEPHVVQHLLPDGFRVDTFGESAWVGLIPFAMHRVRLPFGRTGGVSAGRFSSFPETNVRTYIVDRRGRRGVWFFSLDINRIAPTIVARLGYGLPYCDSTMSIEQTPIRPQRSTRGASLHNVEVGDVLRYTSTRTWPRENAGAHCDIEVRVGEKRPVLSDDLSAFLSARWALGSRFRRRSLWARVEHPTWKLHDAELLRCDETLLRAAGLPAPTGVPIVAWSSGVEVRIERPRLIT